MAGMAYDFWKIKLKWGSSVKQFQEIARISLPSVFSFKKKKVMYCILFKYSISGLPKQSWQDQREKHFHRKLPSHEDHDTPACTVSKLPDRQEKAMLKWHYCVPSPTGHYWIHDTTEKLDSKEADRTPRDWADQELKDGNLSFASSVKVWDSADLST